jgi:hypothetical protein
MLRGSANPTRGYEELADDHEKRCADTVLNAHLPSCVERQMYTVLPSRAEAEFHMAIILSHQSGWRDVNHQTGDRR